MIGLRMETQNKDLKISVYRDRKILQLWGL